jgi:hypothetical protein
MRRNEPPALVEKGFVAPLHQQLFIEMYALGGEGGFTALFEHRLQFHHIFPKAILKGSYTQREADDIANLAFIGGKTNRSISDKDPRLYFPGILISRLRPGRS